MQPIEPEFIYEEWKKTIEDIGTHGMSLELYNHLIGHLIVFFEGDHNLLEYGEEVREQSFPHVSKGANLFCLTKDAKESESFKRLCSKIATARSSLFMDVWDGQEPPELKKILRKLHQLKMALERGDGTKADSKAFTASQMQVVEVQVNVPPANVQVNVPPASDGKLQEKIQEDLHGIRAALDKNNSILAAAQEQSAKEEPKFPTPPDSKWENVRMDFRNTEKVYVRIGEKSGHFRFSQMGMGTEHDTPTVQWNLLYDLSQNPKGINIESKKKEAKRKQVERLNIALRVFFGIPGDPVYIANGKLKTRIRFDTYPSNYDDPIASEVGEHIMDKHRDGESIRKARNTFTPIDEEE